MHCHYTMTAVNDGYECKQWLSISTSSSSIIAHLLQFQVTYSLLRTSSGGASTTSKIVTDPLRSNYRPQPLDRNIDTGSFQVSSVEDAILFIAIAGEKLEGPHRPLALTDRCSPAAKGCIQGLG